MNLEAIQSALRDAGLDGWLFYDFRGSDPLAYGVLHLSASHPTRRWFYFIPARGIPTKIVHAIEPAMLDSPPGNKRIYLSWRSLEESLAETLKGQKKIAMQYSPNNAIPYVSRVDAGTIEWIRNQGIEVVTSADLIQVFEATIDDEQWEMHVHAADELGRLVQDCFAEIDRRLTRGTRTTELDIQRHLLDGFERATLITDHPPIIAVGPHSADPHFAPSRENAAAIVPGSFVLIDAWAKQDRPRAIYADITWVGFVGQKVPEEIERVFTIVRDARDAAVEAVRKAVGAGQAIRGCDVDDVCRGAIDRAGFGDRFIHRTGHSIHEVGHGNGANIDNLETRDERMLLPRTCFSIEPGIYLPGQFGVRSEIDVFLPGDRSVIVSGPPPQSEIVLIQ